MAKRSNTSSGKAKRTLRDKKLQFIEDSHEYFVGSQKLISVTQFVKAFDPPFKKFDEEGISKAIARKTGRTPEEVLAEWKSKAEWGTRIHGLIEEYILGKRAIYDLEEMQAEEGMNAYHALVARYKPIECLPEVRIYSVEHGLAGTIDLILRLENDEFILVDWKTNATLRGAGETFKNDDRLRNLPDHSFSHYTLQLSIYAYLLEQEYGMKCKRLKLVHLMNEKHNIYEIQYLKDVVIEMLEEAKKYGKRN